MKKEVKIPYGMRFDKAYDWLQNEKKKFEEGTTLVGKFNEVELNSDMTEDEMYIAFCGRTKDEQIEVEKQQEEEHRKLCKQLEAETKALEEKHHAWIMEKYGSEEAYRQDVIDRGYDKTKDKISAEDREEWKTVIEKNWNNLGYVYEAVEYIDMIKHTETPYATFQDIKQKMYDRDHSGTTAAWVISCVERFSGDLGKGFKKYIYG